MKKRLILFSLVSAVLAFASCKLEKGGTIEVTNGHNTYTASITIMKGLSPVDGGLEKRAAPNEKVTFSIEEDGTYTVNANFYETLPVFTGHGAKEVVLSGGNRVISVEVTPSK
jgi:hypothetical protein